MLRKHQVNSTEYLVSLKGYKGDLSFTISVDIPYQQWKMHYHIQETLHEQIKRSVFDVRTVSESMPNASGRLALALRNTA